jgi:hypothetical protein
MRLERQLDLLGMKSMLDWRIRGCFCGVPCEKPDKRALNGPFMQ